ncbi:hypothetical protein RNZ50_22075 [Paracoccaceae bacterium Fryx2]|nr:hypothetical protein [Paracoccaceae bacterium Fryx2]
MQLTRKIALASATLAVALGAGHLMQGGADRPVRVAAVQEPVPVAITPLAGEAQPEIRLPDLPASPSLPAPALLPTVAAAPPVTLTLPEDEGVPAPLGAVADACPVQLDLVPQPGAMLGLTLLAPCRAGERVVLRHAGLAVTAQTSATGALFLTLPAMDREARVSILFGDGVTADAEIAVPDLAGMRRFAVQWLDRDASQLHAFEGAADYGTPGHIAAATPGKPGAGGFLTLLGDAGVTLPMQAEVFTLPRHSDARIVIEAAVTEATCGRDLLGETLISSAGRTEVTELTVAMPDCSAIGDILVLKNLVPDLKIAAK